MIRRLLIALLLLASFSYGQQNEVLVLDADTAVQMALEKNSDVTISRLDVSKAEQRLREARSGLFPKLDLSGQYQRYIEKPVIFLPEGTPFSPPGKPGILEIGSDNAFVGGAGLSVPLLSFGLHDGIKIASLGRQFSVENARSTEVKAVASVKKAFLAVIIAREYRNVMQQSLQNAQENLDHVNDLNESGVLSNYDRLRAQVGVENLKPLVLQADNNYELAKEGLKIAIGIAAEQKIEVRGELVMAAPYQIPGVDEAMERILANNPQLNLVKQQLRIAGKTVDLERTAYFPTLAAFGNFQYQTQANDLKFSDFYWVNTFAVGLQVQVPVFNGFKTSSRVRQAQIARQQVLEQEQSLVEALKTQAKSVIYRIEQAVKRISGQEKTVQQADEGYEIAKMRLASGLGTQLELNDAELALRQARVNRLQAIYDLRVAEVDLQYLSGDK